jgi:hypothetical protein
MASRRWHRPRDGCGLRGEWHGPAEAGGRAPEAAGRDRGVACRRRIVSRTPIVPGGRRSRHGRDHPPGSGDWCDGGGMRSAAAAAHPGARLDQVLQTPLTTRAPQARDRHRAGEVPPDGVDVAVDRVGAGQEVEPCRSLRGQVQLDGDPGAALEAQQSVGDPALPLPAPPRGRSASGRGAARARWSRRCRGGWPAIPPRDRPGPGCGGCGPGRATPGPGRSRRGGCPRGGRAPLRGGLPPARGRAPAGRRPPAARRRRSAGGAR